MKLSVFAVLLLAIAATVQPHVAAAADNREDRELILGTWVSDGGSWNEFYFTGGQFAVMSIQPDGHIVIVKTGPLPEGGSTDSISEKDAADSFRKTWIVAGTYRIEGDNPNGMINVIHVSVEKANVSSAVGKDFPLKFRINGDGSFMWCWLSDPEWPRDNAVAWRRLRRAQP